MRCWKEGLIGPELERELWPPSAGRERRRRMQACRMRHLNRRIWRFIAARTRERQRTEKAQGIEYWYCRENEGVSNRKSTTSCRICLCWMSWMQHSKGMHGGANLGEALQERKSFGRLAWRGAGSSRASVDAGSVRMVSARWSQLDADQTGLSDAHV